jgi:phosphohistidine swiveling domain-containing protein
LPRMLRMAVDKLRFSRKLDAFLPRAREQFQTFRADQAHRLSAQDLLKEIDRLYALVEQVSYHSIVTILLMQIYNRILKRQLSQIGVEFDRFDLIRGMEAMQEFDPNIHLATLNRQYRDLDQELQTRISTSSYQEFLQLSGGDQLQNDVQRFVEQFGYLRDSSIDFSIPPWEENPDLILTMMVNYTPVAGYSADRVAFQDLNIPVLRRLMLGPIYRRARQFRFYREAVGYLHNLGYGLFRPYFLALGDQLVKREIIASKEDVFYLYFNEVRAIVEGDDFQGDCPETIARRKRDLEDCRGITPPGIIFGDEAPPVEAGTSSRLRGTPTSRGNYTGPVRVVQGIRDFAKVKNGDVLVIPYSDVGWAPLFTKAGAVVAESGGILSHSSIVAREYNIPAVVSVPGACRLEDDILVTVDGYRGDVLIHEPSEGGRE